MSKKAPVVVAFGDMDRTTAILRSAAVADASGLSDLRVPALLATKWDRANGAGNYYTPPQYNGLRFSGHDEPARFYRVKAAERTNPD